MIKVKFMLNFFKFYYIFWNISSSDYIIKIKKFQKWNIFLNFIQNKIKYEKEMGDYLKNILKVIFLFLVLIITVFGIMLLNDNNNDYQF